MKYDVVVVGAGPAGSTAAKFLAEKKLKVLLLDKKKFPRDKPCGGGVPIRLLSTFPYIKDLIDSYSYGGNLFISSKQIKVALQKDEPVFLGILRKTFDNGLVKLAIKSGVTFMDNVACEDVKIEADKVKIFLSNQTEVIAQIVVGADGIGSIVAKKCGFEPTPNRIGVCMYKEIPANKEILDKCFTEKRIGCLHHEVFALNGFGWVIPKKEHVNIGLGELKAQRNIEKEKSNLPENFEKYIKLLRDQNLIPFDLEIGKAQGGVVPLCPIKRSYANRVVLCGDAAGLVNPSTGAGIEYAMTSGQMASSVIAKALEEGDVSAKRLSEYETLWKKDFGKDIKFLLKLQNRWGKNVGNLIKLAGKDPKFVEMAFGILNGNLRIYKIKWKIVRRIVYLYVKNFFSSQGQ